MSFISLLFYHPVIIKGGHTDTLKLCNLNEYRCLYNALLIHFTRLVIHRYWSVRVGENMKFSADRGSDLNDFLKYIVLDTIGGDDEIWKLGNMAIMERIEFISICVKV